MMFFKALFLSSVISDTDFCGGCDENKICVPAKAKTTETVTETEAPADADAETTETATDADAASADADSTEVTSEAEATTEATAEAEAEAQEASAEGRILEAEKENEKENEQEGGDGEGENKKKETKKCDADFEKTCTESPVAKCGNIIGCSEKAGKCVFNRDAGCACAEDSNAKDSSSASVGMLLAVVVALL